MAFPMSDDTQRKRTLTLSDQAWGLRRVIDQWRPPAARCKGAPVWLDEGMIEDMRIAAKTLDVMAFYGADRFVRREAERRKKDKKK